MNSFILTYTSKLAYKTDILELYDKAEIITRLKIHESKQVVQ
jgi:hypothetical protein